MERNIIENILSLCYKDELKNLAYRMGLYGISKLTMDELKKEIIKENGLQNIDKILDNMSKYHLLSTCDNLNLPIRKRKKEDLIIQVKEFIKSNSNQGYQKQENVIIQKENINIPDKQIILQNKENIADKPNNLSKKNDSKIVRNLQATY